MYIPNFVVRAAMFGSFVALSLLSSCTSGGTACTANYVYGITVTVTDADSSDPICDAVITITDGSYSETLESSECGQYSGAGERSGSYDMLIQAPGYDTEEVEFIDVDEDECHVIAEVVDVELSAEE